MSTTPTFKELAKMIDHSLLHPTLSDKELLAGCELCKKYQVATACVKPCHTKLAKQSLSQSGVGVCTVIGFPHGNSTIRLKVAEAEEAVELGATEVDMVINIAKVFDQDWDYLSAEIKAINDAVVRGGALLKVIFEVDYLNDEQTVHLCEICSRHKIAFVKTSTGFNFIRREDGLSYFNGATDHVLKLMRSACSPSVQVKAAGMVRTLDRLLEVRALGATRAGVVTTETVLEEALRRSYK